MGAPSSHRLLTLSPLQDTSKIPPSPVTFGGGRGQKLCVPLTRSFLGAGTTSLPAGRVNRVSCVQELTMG